MARHHIEYPHTIDKLACPNCGHKATTPPLLDAETGEHVEKGDQFSIHGYEFVSDAALMQALPAVLEHLFSQPPDALHVHCAKCHAHGKGRAFGLHHHREEV